MIVSGNFILIQDDFKAWIEGDDRAFEAVFDHLYPHFYRIANRVIRDEHVAEELSMNTMMKIWDLRSKSDKVERMDSYFFGILRQQIARYLRKNVLKTVSLDGFEESDYVAIDDKSIPYKELLECYYQALEKLSPQQKKVFLMSREEYMSNQEISDRLSLSVHTVNNHIKASLKVIRKELHDTPVEAISILTLILPFITKG
ncbi:sigma-70 family RNA polymerase sigma factor [Sphingobacterium yanglingense]|uniref:RNA polymerase sigma-70 factor (ECF subfamily) n=1 Tax=Sphingobacterium yanglingense TaxID=1437280 RepID=A0A4V3DCS2_9SPHI|nr:sigma-70 family RNA polymerase sigma factor [Sphingobacterium yanglingense]TDQ73463.1 RNA polymerase sigma-70 factor (ECF subfamily) [Sphingobacterium yanglingense]